ncbi:VOC family protein [Pseudonocardia nigra]|uniref:VOC family protein n=1 Tax=Pseudonocardia nigra TaxID=1921578 RepID=UPI0027E37E32|nr:VOC family protein [Pseudonocardia nigra]
MDGGRGRVTADDVLDVVAAAVRAMSAGRDRDWSVLAGDLEWDCWETVEHAADDLFAYATQLAAPGERDLPFALSARHPGGPANAFRVDRAAGPDGLLEALTACGGLLAAVVRTAPPDARAHHPFGPADPEAAAAMGVLEVLVHTHDVARGLDVPWQPPEEVCARVLARLMPEVEVDGAAWPTLLWATGRAELPGRPRRERWRWHNAPVADPPPRYRPRSGLGLVTLVVPDYDEALAFYVGVLGFALREDTVLSPEKRWVVVAPPGDGAALLLARADGERQKERIGDQTGGRVALFWSVTDFAAAYERLRTAGVEFVRAPRDEPYGTVAVFTDPYGNLWDLIQHRG